MIVCKDNASNFCKYFLKKKSQNFFLQKTVGQGHLAKKFFSRIYLSDNRMATFGYKGVYNRRYAEFDNIIYINLIKGLLQNFKKKF